jgi:hypothetical protein
MQHTDRFKNRREAAQHSPAISISTEFLLLYWTKWDVVAEYKNPLASSTCSSRTVLTSGRVMAGSCMSSLCLSCISTITLALTWCSGWSATTSLVQVFLAVSLTDVVTDTHIRIEIWLQPTVKYAEPHQVLDAQLQASTAAHVLLDDGVAQLCAVCVTGTRCLL